MKTISIEDVAVVIPIYKVNPSHNEIASLKQGLRVLRNYPVRFVCPRGLDVTAYESEIRAFDRMASTEFCRFDDKYFVSIDGYNKLLLTLGFYKRFESFQFILIYQLDAWVFRDELLEWCNKGFDYIGAPWFEGWDRASQNSSYLGVGNGGLSLRRVSSHLRVLRTFSFLQSPKTYLKKVMDEPSFSTVASFITSLLTKNNSYHRFNTWQYNEDGFWGLFAARRHKWFKVPELNEALQFSFEANAELLYTMNGHQLPFGCHKWEFYCADFWRRHIKIESD